MSNNTRPHTNNTNNGSSTAHPIHGTWLPLRIEHDGDLAPDLVINHLSLHLNPDGTYATRLASHLTNTGTFTLHPHPSDTTLLSITFTREQLPEGETDLRLLTLPGIYQLVGDRLRICHSLDGTPPTHFKTAPNSARYLATYKRKSP